MKFNRTFGVLTLIFLCTQAGIAQVKFLKYPKKLQLFGRNLTTDSATVSFEGYIKKSSADFTSLQCAIYRDNSLLNAINVPLLFTGDSAFFSINTSIFAELANYRFEIYGTNGLKDTLLRLVDSVVCGDAFIINGQSNAVAGMSNQSAKENVSPFIRVLGGGEPDGSDSTWRIGQGDGSEWSRGNTGQWGLRMARLIVDNEKIPVAIFNGAHSGMPIQFFQRNDSKPLTLSTNYGRLLQRVHSGRLTQNIRAILWHQGEYNALPDNNSLSIDEYKSVFRALMSDWLEDYPSIEKFYVFQIRNGCACPVDSIIKIKEALRELAQDSMVSVMSTSAEPHNSDNCHFGYETGYKRFGDNIYRLIKRDLYGINSSNINAPNVKFVELNSDGMMVTLIMKDIGDSLTWVPGSEADFSFFGASPSITNGVCSRNRAYLTLNTSATGLTALSYNGHLNTPEPMVKNLNGIGALHFYKFPITTPRYRDSVSLISILRSNNINLPPDSVSITSASGRIVSLNLAHRNIRIIPPDIGFMDSLATIDLTNNQIRSLPEEIIYLTPHAGLMVNYNYLCGVSGPVESWINHFSQNKRWQIEQRLDSTHLCNNSAFEKQPFSHLHGSENPSVRFISHQMGKRLFLRFEVTSEAKSVMLLTLNGKLLQQFNNVTDELRIDLKDISHSVVIVQITQGMLKRAVPILID